jgi:glycosyltransferase involved in cell wall biosynthesis
MKKFGDINLSSILLPRNDKESDMKVLVVGLCPYLITSRSKINSLVLQLLYAQGHQVSGAVWGHDKNYFLPENDGKFYYRFANAGTEHKIPLNPFDRDGKESVSLYEFINALSPDVVVTVGDYNDFLYMKAIKHFGKDFKWLFVLTNYISPINEESTELLDHVDGVLCSSEFGYRTIREFCSTDLIGYEYVGANRGSFYLQDIEHDKFRIMATGKAHQIDNLPVVMEAVAMVRQKIDVELYIHASLYDPGDYNLEHISLRFDPNKEFIRFPDKYVSLCEGIEPLELATEMNKSDIFVSAPLASATSISVFDALACGCHPIMSDCGSNRNLAELLEEYKDEYCYQDFLVPTSKLMTVGGSYLAVCDPEVLADKISNVHKKREKDKGNRRDLSEFTVEYSRGRFLDKLSKIIVEVKKRNSIICLE